MSAHLRYLFYVLRHKWFVLVAGLRTGAPLWRLLIHDWSKFTPAEWGPYVRSFYGRYVVGGIVEIATNEGVNGPARIVSRRARQHAGGRFEVKMLGSAPVGAGVRFFAWDEEVVGLQEMDAAFDRAWLHHQHANPHHWQHWILRLDSGDTVTLPMPEPLAREMVADWMGAGRAITGRWEVRAWYQKNASRIQLAADTRALVERLLNEVDF